MTPLKLALFRLAGMSCYDDVCLHIHVPKEARNAYIDHMAMCIPFYARNFIHDIQYVQIFIYNFFYRSSCLGATWTPEQGNFGKNLQSLESETGWRMVCRAVPVDLFVFF